jgi:hypothetical protein
MAYKIKIRKQNNRLTKRRPVFSKEPEQLSGQFRGMKASDIEERFGTALQKSKLVINVMFRIPIGAPRGMPGWNELDFLVETYTGYRAFQTDDVEFVHLGTSAKDAFTDLKILINLQKDGIIIREIEHVKSTKLTDSKQSNATVRELLG